MLDASALTPPGPAQSPFLHGTQVQYAWDSTSLSLLKTCPRLYQYTMIEGWASRDESIHLRFGIEYHHALETYDRLMVNGTDPEAALRLVVRDLHARTSDWRPDSASKAGRYKNPASLLGLVVDYVDRFRNDPTPTYIKADGSPAVELSFRFELEFGPGTSGPSGTYAQPYLLCGHLDRVVTMADSLMIMDRKTTTTTLGPYYFAQYEPNNQMTLYTLAGRIVLDAPIRGVIIDAAQIKLEQPNDFQRSFTYRTDDQLTEWLGDLRSLLTVAEAYATTGHWPMNDTACDKFGGCRFRGICSKSPSVRDRFLAADFTKLPEDERWNPLKSR